MKKKLCEHCQMAPVRGCNGLGKTVIDETTHGRCRNMAIVDLRRYLVRQLGEGVLQVPHVRSPLLELGGPKERGIKTDRTKDNLFIQCSWEGFLPHLKWVLGYKGEAFFCRIITDERLKNVFVGNEGYKARRNDMYEGDGALYNGLEDLIGEEVDLLIVKLGYLGHKNVAAAGCLKEALMIRRSLNRPTWLIDDREYQPWVHSRNSDVEDFIATHFEDLALEDRAGDAPDVGIDAPDDVPDDDDLQGMTLERPERNFNEEVEDEPDDGDASTALDSIMGRSGEKKKFGKFNKRRNW